MLNNKTYRIYMCENLNTDFTLCIMILAVLDRMYKDRERGYDMSLGLGSPFAPPGPSCPTSRKDDGLKEAVESLSIDFEVLLRKGSIDNLTAFEIEHKFRSTLEFDERLDKFLDIISRQCGGTIDITIVGSTTVSQEKTLARFFPKVNFKFE